MRAVITKEFLVNPSNSINENGLPMAKLIANQVEDALWPTMKTQLNGNKITGLYRVRLAGDFSEQEIGDAARLLRRRGHGLHVEASNEQVGQPQYSIVVSFA